MLQQGKYLFVALGTLLLCQLIKFMIESIKARKCKWARFFNGSGGMPSSHTSFATSVTTMIGLHAGVTDPLFAVSLVFTMIVIYDSMGLRMESGRHAMAINQIADEIFEGNLGEGYYKLKEQLGHQPLEVLVGLILGITTACFYTFVLL